MWTEGDLAALEEVLGQEGDRYQGRRGVGPSVDPVSVLARKSLLWLRLQSKVAGGSLAWDSRCNGTRVLRSLAFFHEVNEESCYVSWFSRSSQLFLSVQLFLPKGLANKY